MFSGINTSSNVQEQTPSAFRSGGCEKYENDRGSNLSVPKCVRLAIMSEKVDPLPCCKQRIEEQKCWRTASNSVRIPTDMLQDTVTESAESMSQEEEMEH